LARLTTASGRRLVAGIPTLWLLVLFLIPFIIVFRISFSEVRLAIPPYTPLLTWRHGRPDLYLNIFSRAHDGLSVIGFIEFASAAGS